MWDGLPEPAFLTLQSVLDLHQGLIEDFGGEFGVINLDSIDSAVHQPQASYSGKFLHGDIFEMAAVYLYHLAMNHGFVDGNKRVALTAACVFLQINGLKVNADQDELAQLVLDVVEGKVPREDVAHFLRTHWVPYEDSL